MFQQLPRLELLGLSVIDPEKQSKFRTEVGMLLYLTKHSRPEIWNAVRELTKVLDGATPGHYKMMIRVMNYIMETKDYGVHIKPTKSGRLFQLRLRLIVSFVETRKLGSVFMDWFFTFVECLYHGDPRWAEVWLCLLLRQSMLVHQRPEYCRFVQIL